jgi:multidrug efflux pump
MRLTTHFIKHPVASLVLNAMLIIVGIVAGFSLSVREYPNIVFPTVTVTTTYPNASAQLVETSVTNILEDHLAGIEGISTLTSTSTQGQSSIIMDFREGTSIDQALISIRDAIGIAKRDLPMDDVEEPVVERKTKSDGMPFIVIGLDSQEVDGQALTHYCNINIKNRLRSIPGVASAGVWGQPYCYKIQLDPERLLLHRINPDEVLAALASSDRSLPLGRFQNTIPATLDLELKEPRDFEEVMIAPKSKGKHTKPIFLKDVATVKVSSDNDFSRIRINGKPGVAIGVERVSDANPLDVSDAVKKEVEEIQRTLPQGVNIALLADEAAFIRASIGNIRSSILESIVLVLCVVYFFLRSFRATLIPLMTIPISLIGGMLFLQIFGSSLNILTLLAMVLAVGLVVDDAIVVLENITRHIEEGKSPAAAALEGAKEIGFAVVVMTLTLISVYIPIAFVGGAVGKLFGDFAIALSGSVLISGVVALTLSPLMCKALLKPHEKLPFPQIDRFLDWVSEFYSRRLKFFLQYRSIAILLGLVCMVGIGGLLKFLPHEMAPKEDRSFVGAFMPEISNASVDIVEARAMEVEKQFQEVPEKRSVITFVHSGGGFIGLPLVPQDQRKRSAAEIVGALFPSVMALPSADAWIFSRDTGLPGVETAPSTRLSMAITTNESYQELFSQMEALNAKLNDQKIFSGVRHDLNLDSLGYEVQIDKHQLGELGISEMQVARAIAVAFSGDRTLDFKKDGILYPIIVKNSAAPWRIDEIYLTTPSGQVTSLGTVAKMRRVAQPKELNHYEEMRAATLTMELPNGMALQDGMRELEKVVKESIPSHYKTYWTGAAKGYLESAQSLNQLIVLALIFIYAILALQFDNFLDPAIVLITVPLGCVGALLLVWVCDGTINIYTQVGLITLIGLISKHGILIVEFSNAAHKQGRSWQQSIEDAARLRLRPILMTAITTVIGALPLLVSRDAGYESRFAIGLILVGGLSFGTLFTLFILPVICLMLKERFHKRVEVELDLEPSSI